MTRSIQQHTQQSGRRSPPPRHMPVLLLLRFLVVLCFATVCHSFVVTSNLPNRLFFTRHSKSTFNPLVPLQPPLPRPIAHINTNGFALHGIPKLFRWLVDLYPVVLESVSSNAYLNNGATNSRRGDNSGGSGGGAMKIDNFYLDMNGIIHACTHSNSDKLVNLSEREMFQRIFSYTDRLYKLVKPGKLMFLAVDGVAPRAKMNQQRSRRFRSSKEREAMLADFVAREGRMPEIESFDSNCITPGTEFMHRLGIAFRRWIAFKMETDPFYQSCGAEIVFSGPDVPGEGEHKVMDMIRAIKADPTYDQGSLKHCMYGLDADLIMLSLVTHEPHFILLREKISKRKGGGAAGRQAQQKDAMAFTPEDFELLEISVLRLMLRQHYRKLELTLSNPTGTPDKENKSEHLANVEYDLERIIDDFVAVCFLIGNDFLPSIPHLDISDGSLNLMMNVYRDIFPRLGGYITHKEGLHLPRFELFVQEVARREPLYFQQRAVDEKEPGYADDGYKDFYYKIKLFFCMKSIDDQTKLGIEPGDKAAVRRVVQSYMEGLAWVATYYHSGCGSWTWYYPYLYAPLATDLINLGSIGLDFDEGVPFTPLMQLLSVLPPQSGKFLPGPYEEKMTSPYSPLQCYYPKDFEVDANGKKNSWEAIVQIPFINERLLIDELSTIDHNNDLKDSEKLRNRCGVEHRFKPPSRSGSSNTNTSTAASGATDLGESSGSSNSDTNSGRWGNAFIDERSTRGYPYNPSGGNSGGSRNVHSERNNFSKGPAYSKRPYSPSK